MTNRRGFAVFFIFLVIILLLFSSFFSQSFEMLNIGRMQSRYLARICTITPSQGEVPLTVIQDGEEIEIKE